MAEIKKWQQTYPLELVRAISGLASGSQLYVVGGAVRDWLAGRDCRDLDLAMEQGAIDFARRLARLLGGSFVLLDGDEGVARVVWQDYVIDLADFRGGVKKIEEDLALRDFTINAMAIPFRKEEDDKTRLIDPLAGQDDLRRGIVRATSSRIFIDDPLRLIRAVRLAATFSFDLAPDTGDLVQDEHDLIKRAAVERILVELDLIMQSPRADLAITMMKENGLLAQVLPELQAGVGVAQPASHHLDVFGHNLAALTFMMKIQRHPQDYFSDSASLATYLADGRRRVLLRWAALFHDLGKPAAARLRDGRITFYNHDNIGANIFRQVGERLRWSRWSIELVSRLIASHMWPFHLCNVGRGGDVSTKACLRLVKSLAEDLPGLFMLAMADSLAGQGPGKPEGMEEEIDGLYQQVVDVVSRQIEPVLAGPPLLNGHDLITLGYQPGPLFRKILDGLEQVRIDGDVVDRDQAFAWLAINFPRGVDVIGSKKDRSGECSGKME